MILNQQPCIAVAFRLGHIALARPDLGQACDPGAEAAYGAKSVRVLPTHSVFALRNHALENALTEFGAYRVEQLKRKLSMTVWKARVACFGESPFPGWTTRTASLGCHVDEAEAGEPS